MNQLKRDFEPNLSSRSSQMKILTKIKNTVKAMTLRMKKMMKMKKEMKMAKVRNSTEFLVKVKSQKQPYNSSP